MYLIQLIFTFLPSLIVSIDTIIVLCLYWLLYNGMNQTNTYFLLSSTL